MGLQRVYEGIESHWQLLVQGCGLLAMDAMAVGAAIWDSLAGPVLECGALAGLRSREGSKEGGVRGYVKKSILFSDLTSPSSPSLRAGQLPL